ncbi:MAG TPA: hypothetical protein VJX16_13070 [Terriglobales bacterium]|nr:hypothetical protein [Terriglobales bacterium]
MSRQASGWPLRWQPRFFQSVEQPINPARALEAEFEAAKASLAAGDLTSAQGRYVDTIALGLRQLAQLSLSLEPTDQAAADLVDNSEDKLREVSRGYYLRGQNLRRLGREEEARKALALAADTRNEIQI